MNILKHPIYKAIYDLCHAIEELPASEQQTKIVMMASALEKPADDLFNSRIEHTCIDRIRKEIPHINPSGGYDEVDEVLGLLRVAYMRAKMGEDERLRLTNRNKELESSEHLAGVWECPKCNFILQKSVLSVKDGNIYANKEPFVERCPNDGQMMNPVTLKKACKDLITTCEKQIKRAYDAEQNAERIRFVLLERVWEIEAIKKAIINAEKPTGDTSDVLDLVQVFIEHHKEVEGQRNRMRDQRDECNRFAMALKSEADQLRKEIIACLDMCPKAVRVHEDGGPENIAASLAVTMAKLVSESERLTKQNAFADPWVVESKTGYGTTYKCQVCEANSESGPSRFTHKPDCLFSGMNR